MSIVLRSDSDRPATARAPITFSFGIAVSVVLFIAIPLTQQISSPDLKKFIEVVRFAETPPPPPPPDKEPPPESKKNDLKPDIQRDVPKPSLAQLEAALNPGTGGANVYGFDMNFTSMVQEDLSQIFELAEIDQAPRVIYQPSPQYPMAMRRAGITGNVVLRCVVDEEGRVGTITVVSSDRSEFERPAIEALRQWRFEPGVKAGNRVKVRIEQPIAFKF